jgi:hypothetical protein
MFAVDRLRAFPRRRLCAKTERESLHSSRLRPAGSLLAPPSVFSSRSIAAAGDNEMGHSAFDPLLPSGDLGMPGASLVRSEPLSNSRFGRLGSGWIASGGYVIVRCSTWLSIASCEVATSSKYEFGELVSGGAVRNRAIVIQQKTRRPVQFELLEPARTSILAWLERRGGTVEDYAFPSRTDHSDHLSTRQFARSSMNG